MKQITENTGCKINLFLKVTGRRPDGYHTLSTCFWFLRTPGDTVTVDFDAAPGIALECSGGAIGGSGENIALTAARRYCAAAGITEPAMHIHLRKEIPVAAGLGGGSADAGCVLRILEAHWQQLGGKKLQEIALGIGADVPFFLAPRPALATGVGEEFTYPECALPTLPLVLAAPGFPVSAKWAYTHLDPALIGKEPPERLAAFTAALAAGDIKGIADMVHNDLGAALLTKFPALRICRRIMLEAGALAAEVSGSGPTLFAVAPDTGTRRRIADALRQFSAADPAMRILEV